MREFDLSKIYNWEKTSTKIPTIYKTIITETGTADLVSTILENTFLVSLTIGNTLGVKDTGWVTIPSGVNGLVFI